MTRIRLDYVHEYNRRGRIYRYFRRPGSKQIRLRGVPGSQEFMEAYQAALDGQPTPERQIGAKRTRPGTVNAAVIGYYTCLAFRSLAPSTQKMRRAILERFREDHGDKRIALLPREVVRRLLDKKTPAAARNWLKTLRGLLEFAVAEGFRVDNPCDQIKLPKLKTLGFHTWDETEIAQFEKRHAIGTRARLALALLLYTAQRRGDVVRMGRQHLRDGVITVRQQKTGAELEIPAHAELRSALAGAADNLTFLLTEKGRPFTPAGFGNWFRDRCTEAGLPKNCAAHGLRKAACRRLAEAGCTVHQIAAISGHQSLREIERYTKAVDQARLAREAMERTRTDVG